MKNSIAILEKFEKLSRMAESVAEEVAILDFCRERGLNYDDASDYSLAVREATALWKDHQPHNSNAASDKLLTGESLDRRGAEPQNKIKTHCSSKRAEELSMYGWLNNLKEIGHLIKQKTIGCTVVNRTGVKIAIVAQPKKAPNTTVFVWLGSGESSAALYDDVDAIMIARGQEYFKSRDDAFKKDGETAKEGGFKVLDGISTIEVRQSRIRPDVFYVDSNSAVYHKSNSYPDTRWRLP